jgi:DNA-binding response OmpR family regulator
MPWITGKVVLVEDDATLRGALMDLFTEMGATCAVFVSADEALVELAGAKSPPGLLVTAYSLPGSLGGLELANLARQTWATLPVLLTSADLQEIEDGLQVGITSLQQPYSVDTLWASISSLV